VIGKHIPAFSYAAQANGLLREHWQKNGYACRESIVPDSETSVLFTTDSGWTGIIDVLDWFAAVMPESAGLCQHFFSPERIRELLAHSDAPLQGLPPELACQKLVALQTEFAAPKEKVNTLITPTGPLWLVSVPDALTPDNRQGEFKADHLPVAVEYHIGYSQLSVTLLKHIEAGDVLFMRHEDWRVVIANRRICRFKKEENTFMFEEYDETTPEEFTSEIAETREDILLPRGQIPVKVDFILQHSTLTVEELEALFKGSVLPCNPGAENNIILSANGVHIARGRAVWIDDRFAVEIEQIFARGQYATG